MLVILDKKTKRVFETGTRNIAGERDFNRIEVNNVRPDKVENALSPFENEVASAILELEKTHNLSDKLTYEIMMDFIALLSLRHPQNRKRFYETISLALKYVAKLRLSTKEQYESTIRTIKEKGVNIDENVSYEQMKNFVDHEDYDIDVPNEFFIKTELNAIEPILPFLFQRGWALVLASEETGPFITCDRPVSLAWKYPDKMPPIYRRRPPGLGMKDSKLVFPVTKNIALIGEFETQNQIIHANKNLVSAINRQTLSFAFSQIYAPHLLFVFTDLKGNISPGCALIDEVINH
jgi:hypothetical protein